jgi:hypothetical protein
VDGQRDWSGTYLDKGNGIWKPSKSGTTNFSIVKQVAKKNRLLSTRYSNFDSFFVENARYEFTVGREIEAEKYRLFYGSEFPGASSKGDESYWNLLEMPVSVEGNSVLDMFGEKGFRLDEARWEFAKETGERSVFASFTCVDSTADPVHRTINGKYSVLLSSTDGWLVRECHVSQPLKKAGFEWKLTTKLAYENSFGDISFPSWIERIREVQEQGTKIEITNAVTTLKFPTSDIGDEKQFFLDAYGIQESKVDFLNTRYWQRRLVVVNLIIAAILAFFVIWRARKRRTR